MDLDPKVEKGKVHFSTAGIGTFACHACQPRKCQHAHSTLDHHTTTQNTLTLTHSLHTYTAHARTYGLGASFRQPNGTAQIRVSWGHHFCNAGVVVSVDNCRWQGGPLALSLSSHTICPSSRMGVCSVPGLVSVSVG